MLGFAALTEVALAEIPGGQTAAFPRVTDGKAFIIDTVQGYFLGPSPKVNESCSMVIYVGPGIISGPLLFTFTRPDGALQTGDPNWGFIGNLPVTENLVPDFPSRQYVVYTFGIGELAFKGTWKVSFIGLDYFSATYSFEVV